jgi:hypothetical protein
MQLKVAARSVEAEVRLPQGRWPGAQLPGAGGGKVSSFKGIPKVQWCGLNAPHQGFPFTLGKLGPQCGSVRGGGTFKRWVWWEIIRSLWALLSEGIKVVLVDPWAGSSESLVIKEQV